MLTSIDLFFKTKDASLPVSVEIRDVVNGYPGKTTLPFSIVTKNPMMLIYQKMVQLQQHLHLNHQCILKKANMKLFRSLFKLK